MKSILIILLSLLLVMPVSAQKKRTKVKRKYQKTNRIIESKPDIFVRGTIKNQDDELLIGASVVFKNMGKSVHTNEDGEYYLARVPSGRHSIQVSFIGYKTKITDYTVSPGQNYINFTLDEEPIKIDPIIARPRKFDQQVIDIPSSVSALSSKEIESLTSNELDYFSDFIPGLKINMQSTQRPGFIIRGITSDEVSASAQPRVSVFYNNIPISRTSGSAIELFDMERVEVSKGPQATLYGRDAMIGAVHFVTKKPTDSFYGTISAKAGNFAQKGLEGSVNIPIIPKKLFTRVSGIYDYRDGYVKNTFGGALNGKNTIAGRFSLRYLHSIFTKADLEVSYQKDNAPGVAFMSKMFPNTNGTSDIFSYEASLNKGEGLKSEKDIFTSILNLRHYLDEHTYFTSVTSYRSNNSFEIWDGDGTAADAINMSEDISAKQFTQELRLNFNLGSRFEGIAGASFWREKVKQDYWFGTNEQHMAHLFFNPSGLIDSLGQAVAIQGIPTGTGYIALPENHEEMNLSEATNQSLEGFADASYQLTNKIRITAGVRYIREKFKLSNEGIAGEGPASLLGTYTGNYPNLLFLPSDEQTLEEKLTALTYRGNIQYKFNENANVFVGYSKGRRPNVLQFTSTGEPQTMAAEIVKSYETGFKTIYKSKLWFDVNLFYQNYSNFQTSAWIADATSGEFNYLVKDGGKATSYGLESTLKYQIIKQLQLFGNYAYLHAQFDSIDVDGSAQEYAKNSFRLGPEHSFSIGLRGDFDVNSNIHVFVMPNYSYKSHFFFDDANTPEIEQDAFGILNATAGIQFTNPSLNISFYARNILKENYLVSTGNTGSLFGVPTFVPGIPRMFGTKLTWNFQVKEKPYYKRKNK